MSTLKLFRIEKSKIEDVEVFFVLFPERPTFEVPS